jgi:hypothetical protein
MFASATSLACAMSKMIGGSLTDAALLNVRAWLDRDYGRVLRAGFVCFHLWWTTRFVRRTFMRKL